MKPVRKQFSKILWSPIVEGPVGNGGHLELYSRFHRKPVHVHEMRPDMVKHSSAGYDPGSSVLNSLEGMYVFFADVP